MGMLNICYTSRDPLPSHENSKIQLAKHAVHVHAHIAALGASKGKANNVCFYCNVLEKHRHHARGDIQILSKLHLRPSDDIMEACPEQASNLCCGCYGTDIKICSKLPKDHTDKLPDICSDTCSGWILQ